MVGRRGSISSSRTNWSPWTRKSTSRSFSNLPTKRLLTSKTTMAQFLRGKKICSFLSKGISWNSTSPKLTSRFFTETQKMKNQTLHLASWTCLIRCLLSVWMNCAEMLCSLVDYGGLMGCRITSRNRFRVCCRSSKNLKILTSGQNWASCHGGLTRVKLHGLGARLVPLSEILIICVWKEANFKRKANSSRKLWKATSYRGDLLTDHLHFLLSFI